MNFIERIFLAILLLTIGCGYGSGYDFPPPPDNTEGGTRNVTLRVENQSTSIAKMYIYRSGTKIGRVATVPPLLEQSETITTGWPQQNGVLVAELDSSMPYPRIVAPINAGLQTEPCLHATVPTRGRVLWLTPCYDW